MVGQGPGQQRPTALSPGQLADETAAHVGHSHPLQGFLGGPAVRPGRTPGDPQASVAAHQGHVPNGDGEVPVHQLHLGDVAHQGSLGDSGLPEGHHLSAPGL